MTVSDLTALKIENATLKIEVATLRLQIFKMQVEPLAAEQAALVEVARVEAGAGPTDLYHLETHAFQPAPEMV